MITVPQISPQPRTGNTRLDSQKTPHQETATGLDWMDFRGLLCPKKIIEFFDWVANQCDDLIDWDNDRPTGRHYRFDHGFSSVRGGIYAYNLTDGAAKIWISLPGKALAGCGSTMAQLFVAKACLELGLRCTRLDIYLDDASDRLAKLRTKIKEAYSRGQQSGFRKLTEYVTYESSESPAQVCLYLGSRESASYPRIYDKGEVVRWERQMMRDVAHSVLSDLVAMHDELRKNVSVPEYDLAMGGSIASHLTNGIDFLERKGKNLDRASRLPFWRRFLNWLGALQVKSVRSAPKPLLERTMRWMDRQVSKSFSLIHDILGSRYPVWLSGLIESGISRYKSLDREKIRLHKAVPVF